MIDVSHRSGEGVLMDDSAEAVVMLSRALDQMDALLAGVHDEHLRLPTPCPEWDVESLVRHVLRSVANFVGVARGESADWRREPPALTERWLSDFQSCSHDLLHAWHQHEPPDVVEFPGIGEVPGRFRIDQQTAEFAVHGWDLWKAMGQPVKLDPDVAETALGFMSAALQPAARGEHRGMVAFGQEVPVPADAPVYDRLAGFAGRDPHWAAPRAG
jgi:uncharacterized protein (TIGR03086 family)